MRLRLLLTVLALPLLAACDDITFGSDGIRVEGVAILDASGNVLASARGATEVTGELTVAAGASRLLTVQLRDRSDRPVPLPVGGTLDVVITNPAIAEWTAETATTGRLVGRSAGTPTTLRVDYRIGGRVEYGSPFIPVVVVP
jgi:hypothetical protein